MKLGLDSYSYHLAFGAHPDFSPRRKFTLFNFIDRVAELGLDGFQIDPMHLASQDRSYLQEVRAAADAANLFLEHGAMGLETRRLQRELTVCTRLGSTILRTFAGFNRQDRRINPAREIRRAIDRLKRIRPAAEERGIRIALENHGDLTTDELLQVIDAVDSPWVGLCVDVGNPMLTWEQPLAAVKKMAPHAVTSHFKDYAVELTNYGCKLAGVALGEGSLDLPAMVQQLRSKSNLDRIILEIPIEARGCKKMALAREDDAVRRSVTYARQRLLLR